MLNYKLTHIQLLELFKKKLSIEEYAELYNTLPDEITAADVDMSVIDGMFEDFERNITNYISDSILLLQNGIYDYLISVSPVTENYAARVRDYAQKKVENGDERFREILKAIEL